jgi:hypothetical protein
MMSDVLDAFCEWRGIKRLPVVDDRSNLFLQTFLFEMKYNIESLKKKIGKRRPNVNGRVNAFTSNATTTPLANTYIISKDGLFTGYYHTLLACGRHKVNGN